MYDIREIEYGRSEEENQLKSGRVEKVRVLSAFGTNVEGSHQCCHQAYDDASINNVSTDHD